MCYYLFVIEHVILYLFFYSKKKKHRSHGSSKSEENRRLSVMEEADEEYANSTDTPVSPLPYKSPSDSLTSDTPNGTNV